MLVDPVFYADSEYDISFGSNPKTFIEIGLIPVGKSNNLVIQGQCIEILAQK
jgi:hypothetical protein